MGTSYSTAKSLHDIEGSIAYTRSMEEHASPTACAKYNCACHQNLGGIHCRLCGVWHITVYSLNRHKCVPAPKPEPPPKTISNSFSITLVQPMPALPAPKRSKDLGLKSNLKPSLRLGDKLYNMLNILFSHAQPCTNSQITHLLRCAQSEFGFYDGFDIGDSAEAVVVARAQVTHSRMVLRDMQAMVTHIEQSCKCKISAIRVRQ